MEDNTYVYLHRKEDTNEIFYVGIGKKRRIFNLSQRNIIWKRIYKNHGLNIDIIYSNISWKEACEIEIQIIKWYGRLDNKTGTLANMTNGGEGTLNRKPSQKAIDINRQRLINNNPMKNSINKKKSSEWMKKVVYSDERRKNMSEAHKNQTMSEENKKKQSLRCRGRSLPGRLILNTESGIFYYSLKEARFAYDLAKSTLDSYLSGRYKNKTSLCYV